VYDRCLGLSLGLSFSVDQSSKCLLNGNVAFKTNRSDSSVSICFARLLQLVATNMVLKTVNSQQSIANSQQAADCLAALSQCHS